MEVLFIGTALLVITLVTIAMTPKRAEVRVRKRR